MRTSASRVVLTVLLYPWLVHSQTPESAIRGMVTDGATSKGLAGARVRLQCGQDQPTFTTTDASGHFQFTGIEPAECLIRAEYAGYIPLDAGPRDASGGMRISSDSWASSDLVPLVLWRYGVIVGRVLDADGTPAPATRIDVYLRLPKTSRPGSVLHGATFEQGDYRYWPITEQTAGDRGQFRIAPLSAGKYALCAYGQFSPLLRGDTRYRPTFYPHSMSSAGAAPVEVVAGKETTGIDIQLVRAAGVTVSGRVRGLPPPGGDRRMATWVALWPEGEAHPRSVGSAAVTGGRFELKDVLPGRYVLAALTAETRHPSAPPDVATLGAEQVVEVGGRDVDRLKVAMQPVLDMKGAVSFENGCEAKPLVVFIGQPGIGGPIHADTAPDGTFVLRRVPPGVYRLALIRDDLNLRPTSVSLGNRKVDADAALVVNRKTAGPLRIRFVCGPAPEAKPNRRAPRPSGEWF